MDLKRVLSENGISQVQLAKGCKIDPTKLSRFLNNKYNLRIDELKRLSEYLSNFLGSHIDYKDFIKKDENNFNQKTNDMKKLEEIKKEMNMWKERAIAAEAQNEVLREVHGLDKKPGKEAGS